MWKILGMVATDDSLRNKRTPKGPAQLFSMACVCHRFDILLQPVSLCSICKCFSRSSIFVPDRAVLWPLITTAALFWT